MSKKLSEEHKRNISKGLMGHKISCETKEKMSIISKRIADNKITGRTYEEIYGLKRAIEIKKEELKRWFK